jgi:hypothetical protein
MPVILGGRSLLYLNVLKHIETTWTKHAAREVHLVPKLFRGPGTACKIFQGSPELLSKLFRVLLNFPSTM